MGFRVVYWEVFLFTFVSHTCLSVWFIFILTQQQESLCCHLIQAEPGCRLTQDKDKFREKIMSAFAVIISGYAGWFALFFLFSTIIILNTVSTVWALAQ